LVWAPKDSPTGVPTFALCGRHTHDEHENADLWEYIRRFMQDGPDELPKTETIGKMPWPWRALQATFSDLWPLGKFEDSELFVITAIFMVPAFALFACFHLFSLLLCWEPVFPATIRKACGEPFRAVLEARAIDLTAWVMLNGVLYLVWPLLSSIFGRP
jgi:hypothetical protein